MQDLNAVFGPLLREIVDKHIAETIDREESMVRMHGGREYTTKKNAATILGISTTRLNQLIADGILVEYELGIRIRDLAHIPQKRLDDARRHKRAPRQYKGFERVMP